MIRLVNIFFTSTRRWERPKGLISTHATWPLQEKNRLYNCVYTMPFFIKPLTIFIPKTSGDSRRNLKKRFKHIFNHEAKSHSEYKQKYSAENSSRQEYNW